MTVAGFPSRQTRDGIEKLFLSKRTRDSFPPSDAARSVPFFRKPASPLATFQVTSRGLKEKRKRNASPFQVSRNSLAPKASEKTARLAKKRFFADIRGSFEKFPHLNKNEEIN